MWRQNGVYVNSSASPERNAARYDSVESATEEFDYANAEIKGGWAKPAVFEENRKQRSDIAKQNRKKVMFADQVLIQPFAKSAKPMRLGRYPIYQSRIATLDPESDFSDGGENLDEKTALIGENFNSSPLSGSYFPSSVSYKSANPNRAYINSGDGGQCQQHQHQQQHQNQQQQQQQQFRRMQGQGYSRGRGGNFCPSIGRGTFIPNGVRGQATPALAPTSASSTRDF